jgi:poly(3-hydroxybutyrate) depolymerase
MISGIAVLSGQATGEEDHLSPSTGVNVLHVHGDNDKIILYEGGVELKKYPWSHDSPGAEESIHQWALVNGSPGTMSIQEDAFDYLKNVEGNDTDIIRYDPGPSGKAAELWRIKGFGHFDVSVYWTPLYRNMVEWLMVH